MTIIQKRQHYYRLSKDNEEDNNLIGAIEAYKEYAVLLEERDKHIPYLWISKLYHKLGDNDSAKLYLKKYSAKIISKKLKSIPKEIEKKKMKVTINPLKCPDCSDYRSLVIKFVRFKKDNKGVDYNVPFFECKNCGNSEPRNTLEQWEERAEKDRQELEDGKYVQMAFEYENKSFVHYDHLELKYDSSDYYLIPGLTSPGDDGFLTPVFFDKDLLLYYNGHPDYSVRLFSFSSGNIFFKGEPLFRWGFGINRNGKIFKWLGDLNEDFEEEEMKPHLKRFQASNIDSDHDIYSKFYLSQIPSSPSDAFQDSDNEYRLFSLKNSFEAQIVKEQGITLSKLDINNLSEYYRHPILEDRHQIFSSFLSLNKYLIENIQQDELKKSLKKNGKSKKDLRELRSLKLFGLYLKDVLKIDEYSSTITPFYVLYDLRQLHGHLSEGSFEKSYTYCKERLGLDKSVSDFEVYKELVKKLIEMYEILIEKINTEANKV